MSNAIRNPHACPTVMRISVYVGIFRNFSRYIATERDISLENEDKYLRLQKAFI